MDVSKFPTDNLYKFVAIFGLFISISSAVIGTIDLKNTQDSIINDNRNIEIYNQKISQIKFDQNLLNTDIKNLKLKFSNNSIDSSNYYNILKNMTDKNDTISSEIVDLQSYKVDPLEVTILKQNITDIKLLSYIGIPVGLIISCIGFYYWYIKLQRYLDKKIEQEIKI